MAIHIGWAEISCFVNLVCQGRAHLPGLVAQTPLIPAAACWCWLRSKDKDNDIPGFASLLVNLSSSWCKDYHSYRPHARTYDFSVDIFFQILSSNVYASYYVFPGLCAFSNFSCLSSAFAGGGFICKVWRSCCHINDLEYLGTSWETKLPLLNAVGVCPNAASGVYRCVIVLLEGVSSRNILNSTVSL